MVYYTVPDVVIFTIFNRPIFICCRNLLVFLTQSLCYHTLFYIWLRIFYTIIYLILHFSLGPLLFNSKISIIFFPLSFFPFLVFLLSFLFNSSRAFFLYYFYSPSSIFVVINILLYLTL